MGRGVKEPSLNVMNKHYPFVILIGEGSAKLRTKQFAFPGGNLDQKEVCPEKSGLLEGSLEQRKRFLEGPLATDINNQAIEDRITRAPINTTDQRKKHSFLTLITHNPRIYFRRVRVLFGDQADLLHYGQNQLKHFQNHRGLRLQNQLKQFGNQAHRRRSGSQPILLVLVPNGPHLVTQTRAHGVQVFPLKLDQALMSITIKLGNPDHRRITLRQVGRHQAIPIAKVPQVFGNQAIPQALHLTGV